MLQVFADCCRAAQRDAGTIELLSLWGSTVGDLVTSVMKEHLARLSLHHREGKMTLKRALDIVVAGCFLLLLAPLMLVIAALIKLDSRGPVLYLSHRVGRHGRSFVMLKFRSMPVRTAATAASEPQYTRVGRRLRARGLDELPQLINVLRGDISPVGPRPALPSEVDSADPAWRTLLTLRPGLTGMNQVAGVGSAVNSEESRQINQDYLQHRSLRLDLRLLVQTARMVIGSRQKS
jgi:lipopolysaccharide/colanic/teichoic acid biosynthesis glycosyltransferase